MIIVLLLFFQSICKRLQSLVLHIHDRWVNPKNVRLLKEATETVGERKALAEFNSRIAGNSSSSTQKRTKKSLSTYNFISVGGIGGGGIDEALAEIESCRFCANSPQGFCRHHFHLQELHVHRQQKQQQKRRPWNSLSTSAEEQQKQEYRQLRRINRELKRNLKNRLSTQQQQQQHYQQYQTYKTYLQETEKINNEPGAEAEEILTPENSFSSDLSKSTSGYISASCTELLDSATSSKDSTPSCSNTSTTTFYFEQVPDAAVDHPDSNPAATPSICPESNILTTTHL